MQTLNGTSNLHGRACWIGLRNLSTEECCNPRNQETKLSLRTSELDSAFTVSGGRHFMSGRIYGHYLPWPGGDRGGAKKFAASRRFLNVLGDFEISNFPLFLLKK